MSDKPLFQDADEEEARYGGTQADETEAEGTVVIPAAASANGALAGQLGVGASGTGAAPASGAVIAGLNCSSDEDRDNDGVIEADERG